MISAIFKEKTIAELLSDSQAGIYSSSELFNIASENIRRVNHLLHPFKTTISYEDARREVASSYPLKEGRLAGIPFGIKDIFNTIEMPTEMGSKIWEGFIAGNNARCLSMLYREGALPVGKTVTAEFAVHALNETLNPYDITKTPGTSSSGSAVAVSTGAVPFAMGTQTAASIIRPASFCGVWGMKPSFGLVPRTGVLKTTDSLDTIGFFTSFGSDLRRILSTLRVKGPDYPLVYRRVDARGPNPKPDNRDWRVGIYKSCFWNATEECIKEYFTRLIESLGSLPNVSLRNVAEDYGLGIHQVHKKIYDKSLAYYFQHESEVSGSMSEIMRNCIERGRAITPSEYISALECQRYHQANSSFVFNDYDIIISLSTTSTAPPSHHEEKADPSLIWTYLGFPTINVPVGLSQERMPIGLQISSKRFDDYLLLQFVEELIQTSILSNYSLPCEPEIELLMNSVT